MDNLRVLKSKEVKNIIERLKERFGYEAKLEYIFLINNQNRLYIINRDFSKLDVSSLRVNALGLYFGELTDKDIRLTIEASQMLGPYSTKNVLELDDRQSKDWLKGFDLDINYEDKGYVILKHKNDFLGCGKAVSDKILNFVPKNRRIKAESIL